MRYCILITIALLMTACGPSARVHEERTDLVGSIHVMAAGTASEAIVFEDFRTGERYLLVGDLTYDLTPHYGLTAAVTVVAPREEWHVETDLPKLELISYTILTEEEETLW